MPSCPYLYHKVPWGVKPGTKWARLGRISGVIALYDDPKKLAAAIRKARGPISQKALGEPIGRSAKTVMRWEAGDISALGETPERRFATAVLVAEVTGKRAVLGLDEPERQDELSEQVEAVVHRIGELQARMDSWEREELESDLEGAVQQSDSNGKRTEEPEPASQNE